SRRAPGAADRETVTARLRAPPQVRENLRADRLAGLGVPEEHRLVADQPIDHFGPLVARVLVRLQHVEVRRAVGQAERRGARLQQFGEDRHLRLSESESAAVQQQLAPVGAHYRAASSKSAEAGAGAAWAAGSRNRATDPLRLSASAASEPIAVAVSLVLVAVVRVPDDIWVIEREICSEPRACCCAASEMA